jgi:hypothetical protein
MVSNLRARTVCRQNNGSRITHIPARSPPRRASRPRRIVELHHVHGARFIDPRPHAEIGDGDRGGPPVKNLDAEILVLVALGMALDEEVQHRRRDPRLSSAKRPRGEGRGRRTGCRRPCGRSGLDYGGGDVNCGSHRG